MPNPWDTLSASFNANKNLDEVDEKMADNIFIAWPPILNLVDTHFRGGSKNLVILDYGCGAGTLCEKLYTLGYKKVIGFDSSPGMVAMATKNYGHHVEFIHGKDYADLDVEPVDVIVSVMVFQFIKDIEDAFNALLKFLKQGGLLVFAVHNPAFITAHLERGTGLFSNFDSLENPTKGLLNLADNSIPIFIRPARNYDEILNRSGFKKIFEDYPPFTKEFLSRYTTDIADVPEYLVLGYLK